MRSAILGAEGITDMAITLPVALAASALFAYLTGTICLRTKNVYFIMITLAFGQMAYFVAGSLAPYGGDDGISLKARSTLFGFAGVRERPRALLRRAGLSARLVSVAAAPWSIRASAGCFAARARTRPGWRPSASTCSAISASPM